MPARTVVARKAGRVPGFFVGLLHHRLVRTLSSHRDVVAKPDSFKGVGTVLSQYPLLADSVEKFVWLSRAGTAAKFDLIERPLLNATNAGDGL